MPPATTPPQPATAVPSYGLPLQGLLAGFKRFTVAEYQNLVRTGAVAEDDDLELIEGYLVYKMGHNPPHDGTLYAVQDILVGFAARGWVYRTQMAFTLPDSEPEPDLVVARGDRRTYFARHPGPADVGIVIEVADSSLAADRADKHRIYARAGVPEFWIVNIPDRQIEVYTDPRPTADPPVYAARRDYRAGDAVPVVLDGARVGAVAVADVLP